MSGQAWLARATALVLAPPSASTSGAEVAEPAVVAGVVPEAVAVLGGEEAAGIAVAVARGLAGRGAAVVALLGDRAAVPRGVAMTPAVPRAVVLAGRLADRGHDVVAGGRIVVVRLDGEDEGGALAEAARVAAACAVPLVLCACGAGGDALWSALPTQDAVVLTARHDAVLELAAARMRSRLPGTAVRTVVVDPGAPPGAGARAARAVVRGLVGAGAS